MVNPPSMDYREVGFIKLLLIRNNEIIGSYIDLRKYYMTVQEWNHINRGEVLNLLNI
jgi:deferrochelatase/peroxidase EfeB